MSNDLRFVTKAHKDILLNRKVIAIDQVPLGIMGKLVANVRSNIFTRIYAGLPVVTISRQPTLAHMLSQ